MSSSRLARSISVVLTTIVISALSTAATSSGLALAADASTQAASTHGTDTGTKQQQTTAGALIDPVTFPLVCKGENLGVLVSAGSVRISFSRFPQAAGFSWNNLAPGSCAWIDRAVGVGEPNALCYIGPGPLDVSWVTRGSPHVEQVYNDGQGCLRVLAA